MKLPHTSSLQECMLVMLRGPSTCIQGQSTASNQSTSSLSSQLVPLPLLSTTDRSAALLRKQHQAWLMHLAWQLLACLTDQPEGYGISPWCPASSASLRQAVCSWTDALEACQGPLGVKPLPGALQPGKRLLRWMHVRRTAGALSAVLGLLLPE